MSGNSNSGRKRRYPSQFSKKPRSINPQKKRLCIYNPMQHGLSLALQYQQEDKPCGHMTGNGGTNRWFCTAHHRLLSGGEEI